MEKLLYLLYIPSILGCLIPFVGITILLAKEVTRASQLLVMSCVGCFIMNAGNIMFHEANSYGEALLAYKIELSGNVIFYFFFILFVETFIHMMAPKIVYFFWAAIEATNVLIFWLNHHSDLIVEEVGFIKEKGNPFFRAEVHLGVLWKIRGAILLVLCLHLIVSCLIRIYRANTELNRESLYKIIASLIMVVVPMLVNATIRGSIDLLPFASSIAIILIIVGITKGDFYSVADRGREWIVEHMDGPVVMVDSKYGYLESNEAAKRAMPELTNLARNAEIPNRLMQLFVSSDAEVGIENHTYGKKVMCIEHNGNKMGYALVLNDQTNLYFLVDQWKEEKQRADEANEAKSFFLSRISHEIRTPLNAIVGMTEILLRDTKVAKDVEYLRNIKRSGLGLLDIINEVLDFSRLEAGKITVVEEPYQPEELLKDLSLIFLNRIGDANVQLYYDIDMRMPTLFYGDEVRIKQVVTNIVNNAIKYTDEGYVKVSITGKPYDENNVDIEMQVEDTGVGITEEEFPKLFQSFERIDIKKNHHKEGSGLGLAITKQMVELMGGTITASSVYGEGSTFTVRFKQRVDNLKYAMTIPKQESMVALCFVDEFRQQQAKELAEHFEISWIGKNQIEENLVNLTHILTDKISLFSDEEVQLYDQQGIKVCAYINPMLENITKQSVTTINLPFYSYSFVKAFGGGKNTSETGDDAVSFRAPEARVLIVDDSELNLSVAQGLLEPFEMQVDTATSGSEAISLVNNKRYDLVFMDHMMPEMDGIETTRRIRKQKVHERLPIIALTANVLQEARDEMLECGMNDVLSKPVQMKELVETLLYWLPKERIEILDSGAEPLEKIETRGSYSIEGISVSEGITNCRTEKIFKRALVDFYKIIDLKAELIRKHLREEDIEVYTVEVHALKSTSRMIGAIELSNKFAKLEEYGREKKTELIYQKTEGVLEHLEMYKGYLRHIALEEGMEKRVVSSELMIQTIDQVAKAIDRFDLDGADAAIMQLETYQFDEKIQPKIEKLQALVADVAMEEILQLASEIIENLEEKG